MSSRPANLLLGVCALLAMGGASAQIDCSQAPEGLQPRCELVNRMRERCANADPKTSKACERDNLVLPTREDCTRVPDAAKAGCEQRNEAVDKIERCAKLTGSDRAECLRSNATRPGYRQL